METKIQILDPQALVDLDKLISVFEEVFEMKPFKRPDKSYLQKLLQKDTFFAVIAKTNNKVVGGLTVYVLEQYYSEKPLAYIRDLAILTEYQRKGIGRNLIHYTNTYCRQRGFEEVFVQAEKIDDYAVDFYRTTKPTCEEQVVHFSYRLIDGDDLNC